MTGSSRYSPVEAISTVVALARHRSNRSTQSPPADTTDTVPPGPGRRAGFACPGTPAADSARERFFREGGDTLFPDWARIYLENDALLAQDTLPVADPEDILPGG